MKIQKKQYRQGPYANFFAQGIQVGNVLTLSGQLGVDVNGDTPSDMKGQVINTYTNIKTVLAEFGATMDNVIDEQWFVTDMEECMANVSEIFSAREIAYGGKPEVSQTLVGTSALVDPIFKVEIKIIAHL